MCIFNYYWGIIIISNRLGTSLKDVNIDKLSPRLILSVGKTNQRYKGLR